MSSISSVQSYGSPLTRLQAQLGTEVQAGSVKASDRDALTTALGSIDSKLKEGRGQEASSSRPDPASFKTRIDDLIAKQVSSGSLTSDQADELKTVFSAAAPGRPPEGGEATGRAGDPPPPSQPSESTRAAQPRDTTEADRDALLQQFVEQVRSSVASSYSAGGAANRATRPLVFDLSA